MELTKEFLRKIQNTKSVQEILDLAKKDDIRLSQDEAEILFNHKDMIKELSEEELEKTFHTH